MLTLLGPPVQAFPDAVRLAFSFLDVDRDGMLSASDLLAHVAGRPSTLHTCIHRISSSIKKTQGGNCQSDTPFMYESCNRHPVCL